MLWAFIESISNVEEAMSQVIDWWGDLPPPMKVAIEQFRAQLGAAIHSVEFVKRALDCISEILPAASTSTRATFMPALSAASIARLTSDFRNVHWPLDIAPAFRLGFIRIF
jgi:hypothetical protein